MPVDQRRRQRKLERLAANRKQRRRELNRRKNRGLVEMLAAAATAPVLHGYVFQTLWDQGMGSVLLSRLLPNGMVAFAVFLIDIWCLGAKDAFGNVVTRGEYHAFLEQFRERGELVALTAADVRSLVEGAVAYARDLGIEPHADYHRAQPIFGDIDVREAKREFTFGHEGKPHFFAGPHDGPERCQHILAILEQHCGHGGYHFTVPAERLSDEWRSRGRLVSVGGEEWDDDDEAEDEEEDDSPPFAGRRLW